MVFKLFLILFIFQFSKICCMEDISNNIPGNRFDNEQTLKGKNIEKVWDLKLYIDLEENQYIDEDKESKFKEENYNPHHDIVKSLYKIMETKVLNYQYIFDMDGGVGETKLTDSVLECIWDRATEHMTEILIEKLQKVFVYFDCKIANCERVLEYYNLLRSIKTNNN